MDKEELQSHLQARYKDIKKPEVKAVIRIQDEILSALRDHLRGIGFIEILRARCVLGWLCCYGVFEGVLRV